MNLDAFTPQGNTVAITVGTSASTAVQVQGAQSNPNCQTYLVYCIGANPAFLAMGTNNAVAAVIPVSGTPANGIPVPNGAGTPLMIKGPPNAWFSAIEAAAGTTTVYITPGEGGAH